MNKLDVINKFAKMFLIGFYILLTYKKVNNHKNDKQRYLEGTLLSIFMSGVYIIIDNYIPQLLNVILFYVVYGIIIKLVEKNKFNYVSFIFSCIITYAMYLISTITSGIILLPILKKGEYTNPISLFTILVIFTLIFCLVFTRKRLKNGFNFLKNKSIDKSIIKFILTLEIVIILMFTILKKNNTLKVIFGLMLLFIWLIFSIYIWIKSQITKTYKSKMRDRTIEIQKTEIDEKNKILEEVKEENLKFAKTIHKYNKKLSALEFEIKSKLEQETNTEFASKLAIILKETKETAENFAKETEIKSNKLPETNIPGIDTMLKYMQEEARAKNINLDVKLNASINSLLENIISKDKFETLIGDHLKDAIIAVEASKNSYKSILVTIGLVEGIYEFSVYDTGIEFEIETLLKLGEEQVTTHKETGGSGIGFMTTFETLKECRASLVIEEYNPETTSYTKCITIRFDGKNKYKIYSYRANKLKEQKHKRKITIEELR